MRLPRESGCRPDPGCELLPGPEWALALPGEGPMIVEVSRTHADPAGLMQAGPDWPSRPASLSST